MVKALAAAGVPLPEIRRILQQRHRLGAWTLRSASGELDREAFIAAATEESQAGGRRYDVDRYFCADADLIRSDGHTYALTNQWGGPGTQETIDILLRAFPDHGISCTLVESEV